MSAKQDRHGARTVADLERKYAFGKSFAEAYGLANDAREVAQGVQNELKDMFARDIIMTGSFMSSSEAYLPPTFDDAAHTLWSVFLPDEYPLPSEYDFDLNGDGRFDEEDALLAMAVVRGTHKMEDLPGAVKTKVTITIDMSDPVKTILISGKNMWGTLIETYIGADMFNSSFVAKESMKTLIMKDDDGSTYRYTDDGKNEKEYFNPPMVWGQTYRTTEMWNGHPVYVYSNRINIFNDVAITIADNPGARIYCVKSVDASVTDIDGRLYPETRDWISGNLCIEGDGFGGDLVLRVSGTDEDDQLSITIKYIDLKD